MKIDENGKPKNPRWIVCVKGLCPWPYAPHRELEDWPLADRWTDATFTTWHKVPKNDDKEYRREAQHGYVKTDDSMAGCTKLTEEELVKQTDEFYRDLCSRVTEADQYGVHLEPKKDDATYRRESVANLVNEMGMGKTEIPKPVQPKPTMYFQLFDQGVWWRNKKGEWLCVRDIPNPYRLNILAWLERNARDCQKKYIFSELEYLVRNPWAFPPDGCEGPEPHLTIHNPVTWVRQTPIYRALRRGLAWK